MTHLHKIHHCLEVVFIYIAESIFSANLQNLVFPWFSAAISNSVSKSRFPDSVHDFYKTDNTGPCVGLHTTCACAFSKT